MTVMEAAPSSTQNRTSAGLYPMLLMKASRSVEFMAFP